MRRLKYNEADDLALQFRKRIGLMMDEPIHVKTILRQLNILTLYRPLSQDFHGLSLKSKDGKCFILVNCNQTRGHQHFTVAHEWYHLFMETEEVVPHFNNDQEGGSRSVSEQNADLFASSLLLPSTALRALIPTGELKLKSISLATILKLEQYFGVSRSALLNRLSHMRLIDNETYDRLKAEPVIKSARQYGYDISIYEPGNENLIIGDYGEKARLLFESEQISEGHYIELMNLIGYNEED